MLNPSHEPPASFKAPNEDLKDMDVFSPLKSSDSAKMKNMGVLKTNDHIQIKIKMTNPNQGPPVCFKGPNLDLRDMDVLCTFKSMIGSQYLEHGGINDQ